MLEVRIKNVYLSDTFDFFHDLPLRGKQSRHRTKLLRILEERSLEATNQHNDLIKEHSDIDSDGNIKFLKDGKTPDIKDMASFIKDRQELYEEELVIDGGDNQIMLKTIREVLDECDVELSGTQADLYDYLCEQFKVDEEIE